MLLSCMLFERFKNKDFGYIIIVVKVDDGGIHIGAITNIGGQS